jgi:hypothetical protein
MVKKTKWSARWWIIVGAAVVIACCGTRVEAQQFSADLTGTGSGAAGSVAKLWVSDSYVRIETPEFADGFFVSDVSRPVATFVRPNARQFMDARQSNWLVGLLIPVDPRDPCRQWQSMASLAGGGAQAGLWHCERDGEETIGGRHAIRYRIRSPDREMLGWIDPELKFPLQIQRQDGATVMVGNVRQGPQAASLFEISPGYRKFDPESLIRRIKQSDVWVEQPKP